MSDNKVVVAVDFGTTRTAYATTQQGLAEDDIEVRVPAGASNLCTYDSKTPSNVLIDMEGQKAIAYGFTAHERYWNKPDGDWLLFRWFKMKLHQSTTQDPMVKALNGRSLKLSVVLEKSLEYLKNDVVSTLNAQKGLGLSPEDIIWVVTVPAIWNDWAREMMRTAAFKAGMIQSQRSKNLKIALEPECACISVQMEKMQGVLTEVGQKLMILDCGGGTIDLTAHQVEATDPLGLKELMAPEGGPFGATKIDENFYKFFEDLIGPSRFQTLKQSRAYLALTRYWEDKKVSFHGNENEEDDEWLAALSIGDVVLSLNMCGEMEGLVSMWNARNPHRKAEALSDSSLGLTFELMMSFFEGPIKNIVDKVNAVMADPKNQAALKGLSFAVIAGGFGRSPVLQKRIRENFENSAVRVVVCRHPDLAIVKGAAAFGSRPNRFFESRVAKFTYGVGTSRVFDPTDSRHRQHEHCKYMGPDGKWRIDVFSVHGRAGDDIVVGSACGRQRYRPSLRDQDTITFRILATEAQDVFLQEESGVRVLGSWTVEVDMLDDYDERWFQVEFSFGETETVCRCFKEARGGGEGPEVNVMDVEFPSDIHWTAPTM
ncbi:unnamed protein product [Ostreobium quekettii]|uniref:Uncharacterized protein n=1 Tax=Ostreobium quekettii TaxID=121088 RepID=A0A8S1IXL8_9CHLO|nr:unnamed protein product [Ostreobium quekettii]